MLPEHYWDELEEELEDALLQDFNVEAEDGSPAEVRAPHRLTAPNQRLCAAHKH